MPTAVPRPSATAARPCAATLLMLAVSAALQAQPVELSAQRLTALSDRETRAEGQVDLRQSGLHLTADSLRYLSEGQWALAEGRVVLERGGDRYTGTEARLRLDEKTGHILSPTYHFGRTDAGGQAQRIDFLGPQRLGATHADYSSCRREDGAEPDWELRMDRLTLDFAANEGRAEGAQLRFMGVPLVNLPVLSFPATEAPKSGWLPPTITLDSRGGAEVQVPYYLRLAPNHDLTLTPSFSTRRGGGLRGEYRYLLPQDEGRIQVHSQPFDKVADRERHSLYLSQRGSLGTQDDGTGWRYEVDWQDASDDGYWKDFSKQLPSLTPRLLPQNLRLARQWTLGGEGQVDLLARVQRWRVLQGDDTIATPYEALPQVQARWTQPLGAGLSMQLEAEAAHFALRGRLADDDRPDGERAVTRLALSRPLDTGWGWLTPSLSWTGTSYRTDRPMSDGHQSATRSLPSFSLDAGLRMERHASWFGSERLQTLEPRLHFVNTPRRAQDALPMFDTAASDFNAVSIYADNAFTGVDRISDARQLTIGATSRVLDLRTGQELLRFGAAQRYQFREQQLTVDGTPSTRALSDLLLFASGSPWPQWKLDTTLQYNTDVGQPVRSIVSARWQPQPFHTLAASYRYARDLSEQVEVGWQWPLWQRGGTRAAASGQGGGQCSGTLYGVGRVNYSLKDKRSTDTLYGMEYDAGCWILRVVVQRESTAANESNLRRMIQLELVGLSRLGSNPLQVLKDNIPGYRLLREESSGAAAASSVNP